MKKIILFLPLATMLLASCGNKPRHYLETYDKTMTYYNDFLREEGTYQYNKQHLLTSSVVTFYKITNSAEPEVDFVISSNFTYNDQRDITSLLIKQNDTEGINMVYTYAYDKNKVNITEYTAKGFVGADNYNYKETYYYDNLKRLTKMLHYEMDESTSKYIQTQEIHYLYTGKMTDYTKKDTYIVQDSILFIKETETNTFNEKNLISRKTITTGSGLNDKVIYGYIYDKYNCLVDKGIIEEYREGEGKDIYHSIYRAEYYNHLPDKPSYIFSYDEEESTTQKITYDKYSRITSNTTYNVEYETRTEFTYTKLDWE